MQKLTWRTVPARMRLALVPILAIAAAVTAYACSEATPPKPVDYSGTFYGPTTTMGGGTARAYVTLDRAGIPTQLGVALTETALSNLPAASSEYVLTLPDRASTTPFKHAVINWQPQGHPPPMIYTVPHFDFHFYTIANSAREAILLGDSTLGARMTRQPSAEFIPAEYVTGMSTAQMGMHWNDPTAPERHGETFTKTFIYGSYDGAFIFAEPMISKAFLETRPASVVTPVRLPAAYATPGYHPTAYTVDYNAAASEYRVALSGLVRR